MKEPKYVTRRHYPRCTVVASWPPDVCRCCKKPPDDKVHIAPPDVWRTCMRSIAGDQMQSRVPVLVFTGRDVTRATMFKTVPLRGNNVIRSLLALGYAQAVSTRAVVRGARQYRVTPLGWYWLGWRPTPLHGEARAPLADRGSVPL